MSSRYAKRMQMKSTIWEKFHKAKEICQKSSGDPLINWYHCACKEICMAIICIRPEGARKNPGGRFPHYKSSSMVREIGPRTQKRKAKKRQGDSLWDSLMQNSKHALISKRYHIEERPFTELWEKNPKWKRKEASSLAKKCK